MNILYLLFLFFFFLPSELVVVSCEPEPKFIANPGESPSISSDSVARTADGKEVCISAGCVSAASNFLNAIDFDTNPCENFFKFACGKWIKNNPIPEDLPNYGTFTYVRETVRQQMRTALEDKNRKRFSRPIRMVFDYYNKCMDTDTLNLLKSRPLIEALQKLGGWPMLNPAWAANTVDLTTLVGLIMSTYSIDPLLSVSTGADEKNTSNFIMTVDQGSLGLGSRTRDYYLNDTLYAANLKAYKNLMYGYADLLLKDMNEKNVSRKDVRSQIDDVVNLEKQIANITVAEAERRNHSLLYNKWTVQQLGSNMRSINFHSYLAAFLPQEVQTTLFSNPLYNVIITQPEYMKKLDFVLSTADKKTLTNYVVWLFIKVYSANLDERFDDIRQTFVKVFSGREVKPTRWKVCAGSVTGMMDMAAGALYIEEHFKPEQKTEALAMIKKLKQAFKQIIDELDWMDLATKKTAADKVDALIENVGYADFVGDEAKLDEYYKRLHFDNTTSFFEMNRLINFWSNEKDLLDLLKPYDRHRFEISPAVVNAFYSSEKNSINFPAGILQPPFFDARYPKAINYGAIGAVIGHEITHGFDDQGSQYDKTGNLNNWWSETALSKFRSKTKCIVDQYSEYGLPEIVQKINGKLTQGENIADNGGVKEALKAYKLFLADLKSTEPHLPGLNFTNEQLFWLSYAQFWCGQMKPANIIQQVLTDPHSPDVWRVNGVLANSKEFAIAYDCKSGSAMNPVNKCAVW